MSVIALKKVIDHFRTVTGDPFKLSFGGVDMFTNTDVLETMEYNFYEYRYTYPDFSPGYTYYYNTFKNAWDIYVKANIKGLLNEYNIFNTANYDPISNYDMVEQASDGKRLDRGTSTVTPSGTATNTNSLYRTGINSTGDGVLADKTVNEQTYTDAQSETVVSPDNTQTMDFDGQTKTGYHEANEHYMKRSGNIGVTTTQQMAESEIELRKHDLLLEFVTRFIERHCYYAG